MNTENNKPYEGKTALIVDDDIDFLEIISIYLGTFGFRIIKASSYEEGLGLMDEVAYDLAVFDLMMENPDSGFVLSYNSKKKHPSVPVLILTNVANETGMNFDNLSGDRKSWIKADGILNKSIRMEQLRKEIDKVMHI